MSIINRLFFVLFLMLTISTGILKAQRSQAQPIPHFVTPDGQTRAVTPVSAGWHRIPSGVTVALAGISFPTIDTGWITNAGHILLKTYDKGQSWQEVSAPALANEIIFTTSQNGYFLSGGNVYKTIDGGSSWAPKYMGNSAAINMTFVGQDTGFAIGSGTITRTTDRGNTWQDIGTFGSSDCISFSSHFFGFAGGKLEFDPHHGFSATLIRTGDGGTTWTRVFTGLQHEIYSIAALNPSTVIVGMGDGVVGRSSDGGTTWDTTTLDRPGDVIESISFTDSLHGLVVGSLGLIAYTHDGGRTWIKQNSGTQRELYGVQLLFDGSGFIVGDSGIILTNSDVEHSFVTPQVQPNLDVIIYPNPARSQIGFDYFLPQPEHVTLEIFNTTGAMVAMPVTSTLQIGRQQFVLSTASFPAGDYFYRLQSEHYYSARSFSIIR